MDELFDFSFDDFGAESFLDFGGENFSGIAEQVTKFALAQSVGTGSLSSSPQNLANLFAKQVFAGQNTPALNNSYFALSHGQSMAQLANLIFRAQRRFL